MKLLVGLAVVLALLVGADRLGAALAERALADAVLSRTDGLSGAPDVEVRGFPFLTQVLAGTYDDVRVGADLVTGPVPVTELDLRLAGLRLAVGDLVAGDVQQVPVDGLTASGLLRWDDLEAVADLRVELSLEGTDRVRVSGDVDLLGQRVAADAVSTARVVDGAVELTTTDLQLGGGPAPSGVSGELQGQLDLRLPAPALPYGLVLEQVSPSAQGLRLTARSGPTVLG